jgi:hypothetical protein
MTTTPTTTHPDGLPRGEDELIIVGHVADPLAPLVAHFHVEIREPDLVQIRILDRHIEPHVDGLDGRRDAQAQLHPHGHCVLRAWRTNGAFSEIFLEPRQRGP